MEDNKPIQTFRDKQNGAIGASVWLRNTSAGVFYDVTASRSYKKSDDESGYSYTFGDRDLDALVRVIEQARDYIAEQKANAVTVTGSEREAA